MIVGRRFLEIKTGYPDGYPKGKDDVEQLTDYLDFIRASRNGNALVRQHLKDKANIDGGLEGMSLLFMPSGKTSGKDAALRSLKKIDNSVIDKKNLTFVSVFYLDDNGKIYQISRAKNKQIEIKLIGDKIPNEDKK